jgi:FKBP-type peptidyl-prolyl cis-trans isomerase SlyD
MRALFFNADHSGRRKLERNMLIGDNCVVSINYILKNDSGTVMDESPEGQPLVYLHGAAGIIPGLEAELTGKVAGAEFKVTIKPEDAYGEHQPHMVQQVPRSAFPADMEIAEDMQFQAQTEGGPMPVTVTGVSEDLITVDANHPLAGLTLHFEGSIADVREATEEELAHGHAHGPGGHHH